MKKMLPVLVLLASAGCFRLTDPAYAFRDIQAAEPDQPGDSLVFGTAKLDGFLAGSVDGIVLRRVAPQSGEFTGATEHTLFRAFHRRPMKNGTFALTVAPGLYEIVELQSSSWFNPQLIRFAESARIASRFAVTRPGVYDIGILRLTRSSAFGSTYEGTHERADSDPKRAGVLRAALEGTSWERYLAKGGA